MTVFLDQSGKVYPLYYSDLPSVEKIQAVSGYDIENLFKSLEKSSRVNYLVTIIKCAYKLKQYDSSKKEKALELAKKVAELVKSEEVLIEKKDAYGSPQVNLRNHLLKDVIFKLTLNTSSEEYELFKQAYKFS